MWSRSVARAAGRRLAGPASLRLQSGRRLTGPILLVWPDGCLSDSVRLGRLGCERRPQCSALGRSLFPPGLVPGCAPGSLEQSKLRPKALGLSCKNETWRLETAARTACSPCPAVFVSGSMGLGSSPPPPLVIGTVASPLMVLAAGRRLRHPLLRNDRGSLELHGPVPNNGQSSLIREQCLTVDTPHPRIVLAGDGICCDFPVALMERAAMTGFLAANQLLSIYPTSFSLYIWSGRPRSLDSSHPLTPPACGSSAPLPLSFGGRSSCSPSRF
jgi:hypothetical protein